MTKMAFSAGDGGRRSLELPLACFSFVVLAVKGRDRFTGMTVPAHYASQSRYGRV
jgi:hypothetical protein